MKKTINGKTYNTDTAQWVGSWSNNCYANDLDFESATLYCTKKGAFFLHREGGAASSLRAPSALGGFCGGQKIVPLTREDAFKWCQENGVEDAIEQHFSDLSEEA